MFLTFVILLLELSFASSKLYTEDVSSQKQLWEKFKRDYNRRYSYSEEKYRFANFVQCLKRADELQQYGIQTEEGETFNVNRFADMNEVRKNKFYPLIVVLIRFIDRIQSNLFELEVPNSGRNVSNSHS
jgi:hypothetical protein